MKILVLAGGESAEREISLQSGQAVAAALDELGHLVRLADPCHESVEALATHPWDIVFPMVHGTGGEDGQLQQQLTEAGLTWVGSSVEASALTFDKIRTSTFLKQHNIQVPRHIVLRRSDVLTAGDDDVAAMCVRELGDQIVTKPARQGSSVGISLVEDPSQIRGALDLAFEFGDDCLVEEFIRGREFTLPVVNGKPMSAVEVCPATDWYDYAAKYIDDTTEYVVAPDDAPPELSVVAVRACRLCGVSGIARVDFIVDERGQFYLLEINTVPGMTSHSLVPKSAAAADLTLGQLCESAIEYALSSPK